MAGQDSNSFPYAALIIAFLYSFKTSLYERNVLHAPNAASTLSSLYLQYFTLLLLDKYIFKTKL